MLRFLFAFILLIHGLIHLMGFTKAFKFAEVSQLHTDISKPAGLGWQAATLLFVVSTALFLLKKKRPLVGACSPGYRGIANPDFRRLAGCQIRNDRQFDCPDRRTAGFGQLAIPVDAAQ